MPNTLMKICKLLCLGFLPMLLISNRSLGGDIHSKDIHNFSYHNYNVVKVLDASSEVEIKVDTYDTTYGKNVLKLELRIQEEVQPYTISLFITGDSKFADRCNENYIVAPIDGFLNDFKGIFGVVNMDVISEKPFFSEAGNIELVSMNDNTIKANLNMQFTNEKGKTMAVYGEFETRKN